MLQGNELIFQHEPQVPAFETPERKQWHTFFLVLQTVVEVVDYKWRALNIAVVQRLKKLMAGVADPESVRRDHEARQRQHELAQKQRAEAHRLRQLEKQR